MSISFADRDVSRFVGGELEFHDGDVGHTVKCEIEKIEINTDGLVEVVPKWCATPSGDGWRLFPYDGTFSINIRFLRHVGLELQGYLGRDSYCLRSPNHRTLTLDQVTPAP